MQDQGQVNQAISQAQQQGQQLQNQYNQQSSQLQGQYAQTSGNASDAYQNLKSYTDSMQDPGQLYGQYLQQAQSQYGFNPEDLKRSLQNVATTNTTLANLPQAAQAQGNYYGTTAGAEANNYANQAGNLQGLLTGQTNAANVEQQLLGATQNQANQQAGLSGQFEQTKVGALSNAYTSAVQQMQVAGNTMAQIETLQQQQGKLTSDQIANYQNAYSGYIQAQASAAAARAAMAQAGAAQTSANAQMMTANQQVQQLQQIQTAFKSLYGPQWSQALAQFESGQPVTEQAAGNQASGNFANALTVGTNSGGLQGGNVRLQ